MCVKNLWMKKLKSNESSKAWNHCEQRWWCFFLVQESHQCKSCHYWFGDVAAKILSVGNTPVNVKNAFTWGAYCDNVPSQRESKSKSVLKVTD